MQAEIERRGIVTASITLLPEISQKICTPRALAVPWPLGFPLGEANNPALQLAVMRRLLALLSRSDVPVLEAYSAEH